MCIRKLKEEGQIKTPALAQLSETKAPGASISISVNPSPAPRNKFSVVDASVDKDGRKSHRDN